ncbi:hypothetical protein EB796_016086 [Bugula neritina]|uniref:ShKT domain-containing protein n=1 Tax=Bugula neritina TaxID=10212 RepID=A0A7J7JJR0_BUGNE|nr:hypothetical protein EB796_016086 [Bugula neritina]
MLVVTTPSGHKCEDKDDCTQYGLDVCTDYEVYARENCPLYCKFCTSTVTTTKAPCVDKDKDCHLYKDTDCTEPDFRKFMLDNCRLRCNACDATA